MNNIIVCPFCKCGSRSDGDTTLLLLFHPVHRCCTIVYFTNAVVKFTALVKYTMVQQRWTGWNRSRSVVSPSLLLPHLQNGHTMILFIRSILLILRATSTLPLRWNVR